MKCHRCGTSIHSHASYCSTCRQRMGIYKTYHHDGKVKVLQTGMADPDIMTKAEFERHLNKWPEGTIYWMDGKRLEIEPRLF